MLCPKCGTENPSKAIYCRECSYELHFTPEQVAAAMAEEVRKERIQRWERQLRSLISIAVALLIIAYTVHNYAVDLPPIHLATFAEAPPPKGRPADYLLPEAPPIPMPEMGKVTPPRPGGAVLPDATRLRQFYLDHPLHTIRLLQNGRIIQTVYGDVITETPKIVRVRLRSGKVQTYQREEVKIESRAR